jgi:hypothetical protein
MTIGSVIYLYMSDNVDTIPAANQGAEFLQLVSLFKINGILGLWVPKPLYYASPDSLDSAANSIVYNIQGTTFSMYTTLSLEQYYGYLFFEERSVYDITVAVIGDNKIEVVNPVSDETVQIAYYNNGDILYTSSDSSHEEYLYDKDKPECPNDERPDWFYQFLAGS